MTGVATSSHRPGGGLVHEALLYRGEEELRAALLRFVADAAAAGEPVLVALPAPTLQAIRDELGDAVDGVQLEDVAVLGRNPGRLYPSIQQWVEQHDSTGRRVCVACEGVWPGRSHPEKVECLRQEALLNIVLASAAATIVCPYDVARLDPETVAGAELTHSTVLEGGRRRASTTYRASDQAGLADRWPLPPPPPAVVEHPLDSSLSDLRHVLADDPLVAELDPVRRSDLVMAINEAVINAVQHGAHECAATLWHDGDGVVAEVRSESRLENPLAGRRRPSAAASSGRGLWLINQVCDLVELRSGEAGTTVRMHVHNRPAVV